MLHSLPELLTIIISSFSFAGLFSSTISIKQSYCIFKIFLCILSIAKNNFGNGVKEILLRFIIIIVNQLNQDLDAFC